MLCPDRLPTPVAAPLTAHTESSALKSTAANVRVTRIGTYAAVTPKDINGKSDPYLKIWLDTTPNYCYQTEVRTATLLPKWDLTKTPFVFPHDSFLPEQVIVRLEVWDKDRVYDDFIGFGQVCLRTDLKSPHSHNISLHNGTTPAGVIAVEVWFDGPRHATTIPAVAPVPNPTTTTTVATSGPAAAPAAHPPAS